MNKVDPNLFITCRLCLEELGQYQIIPSIQEQIKSCYDIVVDAFDGLPQLICQKCQTNLSHHYTIKQKYLEKQTLLKQRIESQRAIHEQKNKSPTPHLECVKKTENVKRRKLSSSSEESLTSGHAHDFESTNSWKSEYYKTYNCTLCTYQVKNKKYMEYHCGTHKHLKNKYYDILNQYCTVKLDKFDDKPNKTGSKNTVMLSDKTIIVSYRDYTIHYTSRLDKHESPIKKTKYPCKRNRLFSNSSSDTVVIDNESRNKRNEKDTVCIQISSDEEEQSDDQDAKGSNIDQQIIAQDNDYKTIEHISSNCYSKYLKRVENTKKVKIPVLSSNMESQLNHKVLSIGRKVLNGNYFNCTGLLRFLEYKNLPMMWAPSPNSSRDTNIVVRTLKHNSEEILPDTNWSYITKTRPQVVLSTKQIEKTNTPEIPAQTKHEHLFNLLTTIKVNAKNVALNNSETKSKILNANPVANPKPSKVARVPDININDSSKKVITDNEDQFSLPVIASTISLVPYLDKKENRDDSNKVSNQEITYPRIKVKSFSELMAPKSLNKLGIAKAPFTLPVVSGDNTAVSLVTEVYKLNENQNINICPEVAEEVFQERDNITRDHPTENNLPQISSASNYQSAVPNYQSSVLNSQSGLPSYQSGVSNNQSGVTNYQSAVPNYQSGDQNNQIGVSNEQSCVPNNQSVLPNYQSGTSNDKYVILDTVLLPNEKTSSPFRYLGDLMQCHGLILLYEDENVTEKYYCLIKFKVSFKQDTTEPVVFGMQLYYYDRAFCIKIRDKNQSDISIKSLSADWQWEIMKTFKGDVHNKLLINAQKVSKEAHSDTQCLMSLFSSIKMKKVD